MLEYLVKRACGSELPVPSNNNQPLSNCWLRLLNFTFCLLASLIFISLGITAQAQVWLGEARVTTRLTHCTPNVVIRPGDIVVVESRLNIGPGGPSPTTMRVSTATGPRDSLGPEKREGRLRFLSYRESERVCAQIGNWDSDDSGYVRVGIEPRANLIASPPVINGDGSFNYGYRVGDRPWETVRRVVVELFYAKVDSGRITRLGNPIQKHTLLFQANSFGDFNIPPNAIPVPPAGTTHLLTIIDRLDQVPESNENDNMILRELPNFKIKAVDYDDRGQIIYGYQVNSRVPIVTTKYVEVELFYARGRALNDILPDVPRVHGSTLDLRAGANVSFTLKPGEYPLPPPEAKYIIAVIDRSNLARESNEADNVYVESVQIAPGYRLDTHAEGVAVYHRNVDSSPAYYVTVVDFSKTTIRSSVLNESVSNIINHWDEMLRGNTGERRLKVVINGTFFESSSANSAFTLGLKRNGTVVSEGSRPNFHSQPRLFSIGVNSLGILPHQTAVLHNDVYRDLVGSLDSSSPIDPNDATERTWIGLRDFLGNGPSGEPRYKTMLIFSARRAIAGRNVMREFNLFGPAQVVQLDSGWSTSLIVDRRAFVRARRRVFGYRSHIPHAIAIYAGRQPSSNAIAAATQAVESAGEDNAFTKLQEDDSVAGLMLDARVKKIVGTAETLYQLLDDGRILRHTGNRDQQWKEIENNPATKTIVAVGEQLYQLRNNGWILKYENSQAGWKLIGDNPTSTSIVGFADHLYQLQENGQIFQYTTNSENAWEVFENSPATIAMVTTNDDFYRLQSDGCIFQYTGQEGERWQLIGCHSSIKSVVAAGDDLYQLLEGGIILRYSGDPASGWELIDNSANTKEIVSDGTKVYRLSQDGGVWLYTGSPLTGWQQMK
ncbi:MAG: hypothetical protein HONDAALG_03861 [Gammaproteobacteria bacterium]|nr:hypothetical protein [Gammaproteobacteria bacterium]